jgi:hypothetical protein
MVETNPMTGESTYHVAKMDAAQIKRCAVARAASNARAKLPESVARIDKAVAIVLADGVERTGPTSAIVTSQKDPAHQYRVEYGTCDCHDFEHAPMHLCKHRLSVMLTIRAIDIAKRMEAADTVITLGPEDLDVPESTIPPAPEPESTPETMKAKRPRKAAPVVAPADGAPAAMIVEAPLGAADVRPTLIERTVPAQFVSVIKGGAQAIQYRGLLHLATVSGLVSLNETLVHFTADLAIATAVATFTDGRTFTAFGDATPKNVTPMVAPHFYRMAGTRAKARALRDALNIGMVVYGERAANSDWLQTRYD